MLLQILDDGSLTDSRKRRVDFRNCVIIMTSNLGARFMTDKRRSGFAEGDQDARNIHGEINTELKNHFSPEFLNRLDEVVIFNKLDVSGAEKITERLLDDVGKAAVGIGISLVFDDDVARRITELGYDKSYGARPLKRTVTSHIESPLADKILLGEIKSGDTVRVSYDTSVRFEVI
jgi:ATP-dependent Clp protease ATP-binding subunit ClpC